MGRTVIGFIGGGLYVMCFDSMQQDLMGLDRYIANVRLNWITTPWWLWLILMVTAIVGTVFLAKRMEDN